MKANELRIGDLISDIHASDSFYAKVKRIDSVTGIVYYGDFHSKTESLKPIPLTEEWLLRFGFDRLPDIDSYDSYMECYLHQKSGFRLLFYLGNYDDASIDGDIDNIDLSHVHKLQNLMFAITGKELTFQTEK